LSSARRFISTAKLIGGLPPISIARERAGWLSTTWPASKEKTLRSSSQITINGFRRDRRLEDGCSHYSMEISYNRFERTLELPGDLEGAQVQLEGRDGILLVRLICQGETP